MYCILKMLIYCLKHKKKTEAKNLKDGVTKTARPVETGNCLLCDTKKSVFIKMDKDTAAAKPKTKTPAAPKPKAKRKMLPLRRNKLLSHVA